MAENTLYFDALENQPFDEKPTIGDIIKARNRAIKILESPSAKKKHGKTLTVLQEIVAKLNKEIHEQSKAEASLTIEETMTSVFSQENTDEQRHTFADEIVIENNVTIHDQSKKRDDGDLEENDSTEHNYKSTVTITTSNGQIMRR